MRTTPTALLTRTFAILTISALALTSCAPTEPEAGPGGEPEDAPTTAGPQGDAAPGQYTELFESDAMADYLDQELSWAECADTEGDAALECAAVTVPVDYENPSEADIELVVARSDSDSDKLLFTNPGGPGSSGIDFVSWAVGSTFSHEIEEEFQVIGFDPRGVQRSHPISCLTPQELDEQREAGISTPDEVDWDEDLAEAEADVAECAEQMGPVIGHLDTHTHSMDLELLRRVLGADELNYLGFSYGTSLGARYAENFPEHVGAMVLDGAMDPSAPGLQIAEDQMHGFISATRDWANYCLTERSEDCALTGNVDQGLDQIRDRLLELDENPRTINGRTVNGLTWLDGFIVPLYDQRTWDMLVDAHALDTNSNNPAQMLALADLNYDRNADGTYGSNISEAFGAINCADYGGYNSEEELREHYTTMTEASDMFGRYFVGVDLTCTAWPNAGDNAPTAVSAEGAPEILVIGTTGDPATPYKWSEALAEQLSSGVLLTYEGFGHTAYGGKSGCVDAAVEGFLIDGTVPEDGTTCQ